MLGLKNKILVSLEINVLFLMLNESLMYYMYL